MMCSVSLTEGGQFIQRWLEDAERIAWLDVHILLVSDGLRLQKKIGIVVWLDG